MCLLSSFLSSLLYLSLVVTQLPGKKDLFIEADLMSPLDRIANVSTLRVTYSANLLTFYIEKLCWKNLQLQQLFQTFCFFLQQHEVDKLYKVEYKPITSTSDQWGPALFILCTFYTHTWWDCLTTWHYSVSYRLCFLIRPRIQTVKWICGKLFF